MNDMVFAPDFAYEWAFQALDRLRRDSKDNRPIEKPVVVFLFYPKIKEAHEATKTELP
jgi:hypothetical protein